MIPHPHRRKGGAPLLGATAPGEPGPFGVRPDEDEPDDGGQDGEPESTSAVDLAVQQRIAAAKARIEAAKKRRDGFAEARRRGLARRHAQRLRNLAAAEQRRLDDQDDEQHDQDHDTH